MIYPKFPRRTLALVLFFLVLTLGVVGIIFVVYFFNEKSALVMENPLKTIYEPENENQKQYRQNIIGNGYFEFEPKPPTYGNSKDLESNIVNDVKSHFNRSSLSENSDENLSSASDSQERDSNQGKQTVLAAKTFNPKDTNLDTIYIDDDERPSYSSKSKSESSNIDYFDMILVDHKKDNAHKYKIISMQKWNASYKPSSDQIVAPKQMSRKYQKHLDANDRRSTINSRRPKNMNLLRYSKEGHNNIQQDDDDVYDLEIDTMGSGSGDFFDDTEINDIFTKRNKSIKLNKKPRGNSIKKKNNIKTSRIRKNYRNFKGINYLPPPTASTSDDPPNWINRNHIGKLAFYSTRTTTSQAASLKPLQSQTVVKSEKEKENWPAPGASASNYASSNNNSANIPTPPYNSVIQTQLEFGELEATAAAKIPESSLTNLRETAPSENNEALIETRTRRIKGNVKKSEERSRQLLLCEEDGVGELCRMLFKGHIND